MDYTLLTQIPLFREITPEELEKVFTALKVKEQQFSKGDILAIQDEPANRLIILTGGSIKGEMTDPSGKFVKVEDVHAPNPLAILFLFGANNRFPVQATAREKTQAVIMPRQAVLKMLSMNETILRNYLDISADFASRLSRKLQFMSLNTIRQKMAMYLLQLSKATGSDSPQLDRTKSALAEYFGVSRPSLQREITRMHNDGLIESGRKSIKITDRVSLLRAAYS